MTDKQLRKLRRTDLLAIMIDQQKEIERLNEEVERLNKELEESRINIARAGSIAQASFAISDIFEEAQKVADSYLANVRRLVGEEKDVKTLQD